MQAYALHGNSSRNMNVSFPCDYSNNYDIHCKPLDRLPACIQKSNDQFIAGLSICTLGIVGNLMFMFVVVRIPHMRTATNAYLVNLAVADLLHLMSHWLMWICAIDKSWLEKNLTAICVTAFVSRVAQYVSLFTVTVLSLERYTAFCKPHAYREGFIHKRKRVIQVIFFKWSLAILLSLEFFTGCLDRGGRKLPELIFESIFVIVVFGLMCAVMSVYCIIIREVHRMRNTSVTGSIRAHEHQIMRVCLTTALVHFTLTLPLMLQVVIYLLLRNGDVNIPQDVFWCLNNPVVYSLEINSSSNLLIYNAMSSKYRKAFRDAFSIDFGRLRNCSEKVQNVRRPNLNSPTIDKEMTIFSSCSQPYAATSATNC